MSGKNYIINEDFTSNNNKYYVVFITPNDVVKRVEGVEKIQLVRNSPDALELKIKNNDRWLVYHYVNEHIDLLDKFDIGLIN